MILKWVIHDNGNTKFAEIRSKFEENLQEQGLILETQSGSKDANLKFVKISAPWHVLSRYADVMRMRMPMKKMDTDWLKLPDYLEIDEDIRFSHPFHPNKCYLFDIPEKSEDFFSSAQRSQIVDFILKRTMFLKDNANTSELSIGIESLLKKKVYQAAYPLHEGYVSSKCPECPRAKLFNSWASLSKFFSLQPLDDIRYYLGVKCAVYTAWLGFYTTMLIPASIAGLLTFFIGIYTNKDSIPTTEICNKTYDNILMCPMCEESDCEYWFLSSSCSYSFLTNLLDNPSTPFFSCFMVLWAVVFIELWKGLDARLAYRWDLTTFDYYEEVPRPEYLAHLGTLPAKEQSGTFTFLYEPNVSWWYSLSFYLLSFIAVIACMSLAIFCLVGVIMYRIQIRASISYHPKTTFTEWSPILIMASSGVVNLICIYFLNYFHGIIAHKVTEWELPRTRTDFEDSLTVKLYALQFVNYYSALIYIAFFKSRFKMNPGKIEDSPVWFIEECGIGGCFGELSVQLIIIMVGKQVLASLWEMIEPWLSRINKGSLSLKKSKRNRTQWESDYYLVPWTPSNLFYEYLEMILQFGFVTLFVSAFPLAPFFALLNNAFEIRLDARKFLTQYRRPVAVRVKSIGTWYGILSTISHLSLVCNAFILAFTSDFIPKLYYWYHHGSLAKYVNSTLSLYNATFLQPSIADFIAEHDLKNVSSHYCTYQGRNYVPGTESEYQSTPESWRIFALRLFFVIVFHNFMWFLGLTLKWAIPNIPRNLKTRIRQSNILTNEIILHQEALRSKARSTISSTIHS
ncbi:anoctamin 1 isoform X2 [Brevipalpus obovatus]|uniref:anoctamin 1 isoform X2 n=1 Tax=Brevipalpus obovatus TaxID=246614 RepID=UPI003D9F8C2B